MLRGALNADVIVFQRPDDKARLNALPILKEYGKKVVFDNDDTYLPDSGVPTSMSSIYGKERLKEMNENLYEFIKNADLVTTTTGFLAKEYAEINPKVVVLPNCVDPDDWDEPLKNTSPKVRIGFVGSVLANNDYNDVKPLLERLNANPDVQIVVYGLPPDAPNTQLSREVYKKEIDFWNKFNIEWQPFTLMADYQETLNNLRLDLMLIPRHESYFNKCKSNLKFLEAAMLEIPVVASAFSDGNSPYEKDIKSGENGFLIQNAEDWIPVVDKLIADKDLREKIGLAAKEYVLQNYNIHNKAHLWEEAYKLC
jgi:glycosyltransferase involved in cell wall biosynthesis